MGNIIAIIAQWWGRRQASRAWWPRHRVVARMVSGKVVSLDCIIRAEQTDVLLNGRIEQHVTVEQAAGDDVTIPPYAIIRAYDLAEAGNIVGNHRWRTSSLQRAAALRTADLADGQDEGDEDEETDSSAVGGSGGGHDTTKFNPVVAAQQ